MIKASIIGASGYVGIELIRLLLKHPEVEISSIISSSNKDISIENTNPQFKKILNLTFKEFDIDLVKEADVVFCALPHGVSQEYVKVAYDLGKVVIDLSSDFRYKDLTRYSKDYGNHKYPELLNESSYGLCEIFREEIKSSKIVGNPGCYPTSAILGLAPLLKNKLIQKDSIIIDSKSGVSGAGKKADFAYSFCEVDENFKAYGVAKHRHTSEIEEKCSFLFGEDLNLSFTPHLLPVKRGILSTIYATFTKSLNKNELIEIYKEFYRDEFFIRIYEDSLPELKYVTGTNFVDIGLEVDKKTNRVIVISCIDNLIKGAAGQAIQNMNIKFSLNEKTGLVIVGEYF
ncbi:N-acetyl-gamma-glutamyl-phosphate reductase [Caldicellulosiruptor saccharolyticus DSM 8903]|uniref:N-acetyl-gamma-glutamyl-phosphate reductase n=1 Tax=Caldicellulosiruptor saccharolyticus (strain ATCC 43494 / DSM 8903 / Tp8T 6331) TaxID=351627 RepID=ARGC_CALS8|nr:MULTISPECIES: N-acetyl-gamma-glutamyl-phosphate reductase [Caldicellulosiruptor]A4XJN9.1 RecName: Full=N-acetyl-gamma-glutamyl-phosphate reductase; Short=AGPR; AltName: Full=N-acetyl-glutamate semialdehyde dehydrogenase; Short=NAGSA dehydrogenase [Caldicellulosiruptor saccharolyticus DSM 8903]ABP67124.1 N-acetyl-gamma-glutamyl-phosphate reductase [Caldicellulosiruptor saccharolyticus DSM 8903]